MIFNLSTIPIPALSIALFAAGCGNADPNAMASDTSTSAEPGTSTSASPSADTTVDDSSGTEPTTGDSTGSDTTGDDDGFVMIPFDEAEFFPADPMNPDGPAVAFLWGNPEIGPITYLLRIPPDPAANLGPHVHSSRYDAISLTPGWRHWLAGEDEAEIEEHPPGTYVSQPANQPHSDDCQGPDDCYFFLHMPGVFDFIPTPEPDPVTDPEDYTVVTPAEREFAPIIPEVPDGPSAAVVYGDPGAGPVTYFLDLPADWNSGLHTHTSDYHAIGLGGGARHWLAGDTLEESPVLDPFTYWYQPSSVVHGDACDGPESCTYFLVMPQGLDFIPQR